jgi:hypothetical protein
MKGVISPDTGGKELLQIRTRDLEELLDNFLSAKLEEMGFKKNDNGREDTLKMNE